MRDGSDQGLKVSRVEPAQAAEDTESHEAVAYLFGIIVS
jgi:hypothetical protein